MQKLPKYEPLSHKGEDGKVLAVGGSPKYYGSAILTACGAEFSGADLIWLYLPKEYSETAHHYSLNFFINNFVQPVLTARDVENIINTSRLVDTIVIGNGLGNDRRSRAALLELLPNLQLPTVIDAEALFPEILKIKPDKADWILTPHKGEFARTFAVEFSPTALRNAAKEHGLTILVKGHTDYIATPTELIENHSGCAQMRVGGTGDVLAGIVAGYRAQGLKSLEASHSAAYYYGKAGEMLAERKYSITAYNLAKYYPVAVKNLQGRFVDGR